MEKRTLKRLIDVAAGRIPADLCLKNCKVVDVYNRQVFAGDIYIADGFIAGFGNDTFVDALATYDVKGKYIAPGFIDSHVHIESSHLSPAEFSRKVVPHGVTTVIADPHEICNVCGLDGFDYMLNASENIALQVFLQLPSCVPATPFENAGAILGAKEIGERITNERVLGLGELMNFVGTSNGDNDILDKIMVARKINKIIDGHCPGLTGPLLDAYGASGVANDHECTTAEELRDKLRRGIYVLVRQGTGCQDVLNLVPGIDEKNYRFCLFCTDDRQAWSLEKEGSIDNNYRLAVSAGLDPLIAICMSTINAAECFGLRDRGAVAPGKRADLIMFDDLNNLKVESTWIGGRLVAKEGAYLAKDKKVKPVGVEGKMNVKNFSEERLRLHLKSERVRTIRMHPIAAVTVAGEANVKIDADSCWVRDNQDIVKIAVVERHKGTGNVGVGLLENYGLKGGALAMSIAHDSHNIITVGDNDRDMAVAVNKLVEIGGGITIVKDGKVLDYMEHEIAGLMTDKPGEYVAERLYELVTLARTKLNIHKDINPFMPLCFIALPVIPELKITDMGLFDVNQFCHVDICL